MLRAARWPTLLGLCVTLAVAAPLFPDRSLLPESELGLSRGTLQAETLVLDPTPAVVDLPREGMIARGFHELRLPLWNPSVGAGTPLWADQGGPYFPLKWLYYAFPSRLTYHLVLFARLLVAFLGAWFLARALGHSNEGAAVAAAAFATSGIALTHLSFMAATSQFLLPWCALAGLWAARQQHGPWPAVVVGLNLMGGHPTLAALGMLMFGVCGCLAWAADRSKASAVRLGTTLFGGALLAAAVVLPFLDSLRHGVSYKGTVNGAALVADQLSHLHKGMPVAMAWPTLVHLPGRNDLVAWPIAAMCTLGAVTTALAGAGLRKIRQLSIPAAIAGAGLVLTLHVPPGLIEVLPLLRDITPLYPLSVVALGMGLLAGAGVDVLAKERWVPLGLGAVVWAALVWLGVEKWNDNAWQIVPMRALPIAMLALIPAAVAAASFPRRWTAAMLVACVAAEPLITMRPALAHASDPRLYRAEPVTPEGGSPDSQGRFYSQTFHSLFPNAAALTPLSDLRAVSAIVPQRFADFLQTMGGYQGTWVTPRSPTANGLGLAGVSQIDEGHRWKPIPAVARFRLVHAVTFVGAADALRATQSLLSTDRWLREIVVEGEPRPVGPGEGEESVAVAHEAPETIRLDVTARAPGYVVVNDTWAEGWTATVDGTSVPIVPVNLGFRGVWVEAGRHRVEMNYAPRAVWGGLFVSLATAAAIAWQLRRTRRAAAVS